jgi:hypothetical protein
MAANGDTNIPNELSTVIKEPGVLTNRQGLMQYPTIHWRIVRSDFSSGIGARELTIMRAPRLTSIHRGAREARSIPAATEF